MKRCEEIKRVIEVYDERAASGLLPSYRLVTPQRKKFINARIQEYGLEDVIEAVKIAADAPFLRDNVKAPWYSFEWIFRPQNFIKVIEGKYTRAESPVPIETSKPEKPKIVVIGGR